MKTQPILYTVIFLLLSITVSAQDNEPTRNKRNTIERGYRAQSFYFEAFGPGALYSVNYDTRFQSTLNGVGGRIGLSFISVDNNSVFTLPAMINYLLGKEGKYFEVGLGATFISFDSANDDDVLFVDDSGFFGTMVFGYRYQPTDGGFMFRAGMSPLFGNGNFIPYYPYISFGYTF